MFILNRTGRTIFRFRTPLSIPFGSAQEAENTSDEASEGMFFFQRRPFFPSRCRLMGSECPFARRISRLVRFISAIGVNIGGKMPP